MTRDMHSLNKSARQQLALERSKQSTRDPIHLGKHYVVAPRLVPVILDPVGGSSGDKDNPPTWVYDLYGIDDTLLATKLNTDGTKSPLARPTTTGFYVQQLFAGIAYGLAFTKADGSWLLWSASEQLDTSNCQATG